MRLEPQEEDQPGPAPGEEIVDLAERAWLPRHCRGDTKAFPALLAAYRRPVYGYLVRAGVRPEDRDDLFQQVFLKVHAKAGTYEPARPLAPWLFTVVTNTVRNHFRDRARHDGNAALPDAETLGDGQPDPERVAAARQSVARLEEALKTLPLSQREVILLTCIVGLRQQEVAEALALPLNTVKTHLRRGRLVLAAALERSEGPDIAGGLRQGESHEDL